MKNVLIVKKTVIRDLFPMNIEICKDFIRLVWKFYAFSLVKGRTINRMSCTSFLSSPVLPSNLEFN